MVKRYSVDSTGRAWSRKEGTYVLASDYDILREQYQLAVSDVVQISRENASLRKRLAEARDARDLAEGKLIAHERMAERIHAYCRELSDAENVRLTGYEPWEAWLELDGALAELRRAIADSADPVQQT